MSRGRTLVLALLVSLPLFGSWPAPTAQAADQSLSGELVILNGSSNRFRIVGHDGPTYTAPSGVSLEPYDGKNVRVDLRGGRVEQITAEPVAIDRIEHSREVITGSLVVGDAVNRTFTLSGDPRVYVAPATMDIRPYNGRRVEIHLDDHSQVETIEPLALAPAVPVAMNCSYGGEPFSDGAAVCQAGMQYRCEQGAWRSLGLTCSAEPAACDVDGVSYAPGSTRCVSQVTFTCDVGQWRNTGQRCTGTQESAASRATRSCLLGGATLANGSYICRDGNTMRCADGTWVSVGKACS